MLTKHSLPVAAKILGLKMRISKKGVPYLIYKNHSLCFMQKTKIIRVFYPAFSDNQERTDFDDTINAINFIDRKYE